MGNGGDGDAEVVEKSEKFVRRLRHVKESSIVRLAVI
jgi:hypothetical protein